jgi:hypothetical protein
VTTPEDDRRKADEDAVWRDIVESYGDRPTFPEPEPEPEPVAPAPEAAVVFEIPRELSVTADDEDHFVPPEPPPVPVPQGPRAIAWAGVFGMPLLMLVLVIVNWSPPSPTGLLMVVWFVGGFGYLVATMRGSGDDDPWSGDDGAVL